MHGNTRGAVLSNCDLAYKLPVGVWFTKDDFCDISGIKIQSCNRRLRELKNKGALMCSYQRGGKAAYFMTEEMKVKMSEIQCRKYGRAGEELAMSINKLLFSTSFFRG
jgi:hypothetical protein